MPFTLSHAVVALPAAGLAARPVTNAVPAAIAIGAMAPDLPLFTGGLLLPYGRTHDPAWLPLTTLVACALLLVWRCVLRPAVRELSPLPLASRLSETWDAPAGPAFRATLPAPLSAVWIVVAAAIGVLSHIAWDLFSHEGRAGVVLLPVLDEQWGPLTGYKWVQHGSSAVGLLILGIWAFRRLRAARPAAVVGRALPAAVRRAWWASLPAVLAAAWILGLALFGPLTATFTVQHLAYRVLPQACGLWAAATAALCLVVQVVRARRCAPGDRRGPDDGADPA